jgi:hypothetical protein
MAPNKSIIIDLWSISLLGLNAINDYINNLSKRRPLNKLTNDYFLESFTFNFLNDIDEANYYRIDYFITNFFISYKGISMLRINYKSFDNSNMRSGSFHLLFKHLKNPEYNIKKIQITADFSDKDISFNHFINLINSNTRKEFKFEFRRLNLERFNKLMNTITINKNIIALSIDLVFIDFDYKIIGNSFKSLLIDNKSIKYLNLGTTMLSQRYNHAPIFKDIFDGLEKNKSVEFLYLNKVEIPDNKLVYEAMENCFTNNKTLKYISLVDTNLKEIFKYIRNNQSIESINISQMNFEETEYENILKNKKLIRLHSPYIKDSKNLTNFFKSLEENPNINYLSIDGNKDDITLDISCLFKCINSMISKTNSLINIYFYRIMFETDHVEILFNNLKTNNTIKFINFTDCVLNNTKIINVYLAKITELIQVNNVINSICFTTPYSKEFIDLDEFTLINLLNSIGKNPNIHYIYLPLNSVEFTYELKESWINMLKNNNKIQYINFHYCPKEIQEITIDFLKRNKMLRENSRTRLIELFSILSKL